MLTPTLSGSPAGSSCNCMTVAGHLTTALSGTSRASAAATPATNLLVVDAPTRSSVMDGPTAATMTHAIVMMGKGGLATSAGLGDAFLNAQAASAAGLSGSCMTLVGPLAFPLSGLPIERTSQAASEAPATAVSTCGTSAGDSMLASTNDQLLLGWPSGQRSSDG